MRYLHVLHVLRTTGICMCFFLAISLWSTIVEKDHWRHHCTLCILCRYYVALVHQILHDLCRSTRQHSTKTLAVQQVFNHCTFDIFCRHSSCGRRDKITSWRKLFACNFSSMDNWCNFWKIVECRKSLCRRICSYPFSDLEAEFTTTIVPSVK